MASPDQPIPTPMNQKGSLKISLLTLLLAVLVLCTLLSACAAIYIVVANPIRTSAPLPATSGPVSTGTFPAASAQTTPEQQQQIPIAPTRPLPTPTFPPQRLAPGQCPYTYVVRPGDTVLGISVQCGLTVQEIARANNLSTTDSLRIGQEIVIPSGSQPATVAPIPLPTKPLPTPSVPGADNTPVSPPTLPTLTLSPMPTQSPLATPLPSPTSPAKEKCTIDAWVSNEEPDPDEELSVFAELLCDNVGVGGAPMQTKWNFEDGAQSCDEGTTDEDGFVSCTLNIGAAKSGYYVRIDITITWQGQAYTATSGFTPK